MRTNPADDTATTPPPVVDGRGPAGLPGGRLAAPDMKQPSVPGLGACCTVTAGGYGGGGRGGPRNGASRPLLPRLKRERCRGMSAACW
uniref:Uncharacterized protein n=1 Tax=Setaria viridis TaxID=4556 RepID=A0A4U6TTT0_SETVI|nr:hypothetical protein SEVIR_7G143633v2 [Setaria viridis]